MNWKYHHRFPFTSATLTHSKSNEKKNNFMGSVLWIQHATRKHTNTNLYCGNGIAYNSHTSINMRYFLREIGPQISATFWQSCEITFKQPFVFCVSMVFSTLFSHSKLGMRTNIIHKSIQNTENVQHALEEAGKCWFLCDTFQWQGKRYHNRNGY